MKTETLIATKHIVSTYNQSTILTDNKGNIKTTLNGYNQPRKGTKEVTYNGVLFNLTWNKTIYIKQ